MKPKGNRRKLVKLKEQHGLTYADIAELAGANIKTAERWLATETASSYIEIPAWRLELIELRLRLRKTGIRFP